MTGASTSASYHIALMSVMAQCRRVQDWRWQTVARSNLSLNMPVLEYTTPTAYNACAI